jgi:NAD(P)-dependent dehydrogenase (short-subunit alcohol dehydrogenase family)
VPDADEAHGVVPETQLTRKELENPATRARFIPMKRPVQAQEIADAAVFLAPDMARRSPGTRS